MINQLLLNGIIAGSIYSLVAIGFKAIYRTVKFFHFAHGVVYTAGAHLAYALIITFQLNFAISFFLSIFLASIFGVTIDKLAYYPLRKKTSPKPYLSPGIIWCVYLSPKFDSINLWRPNSNHQNKSHLRRSSVVHFRLSVGGSDY